MGTKLARADGRPVLWIISPEPVPYPVAWNGSLWSLYYEFLCYLAIGGLLAIGVLRRHPLVLVPVFAFTVWFAAHPETALVYTGGNGEIALLMTLLPFFLSVATASV